jgi:hypothetical protein
LEQVVMICIVMTLSLVVAGLGTHLPHPFFERFLFPLGFFG